MIIPSITRNPTHSSDTLEGRTASYTGGNPVAEYYWRSKDGDPKGYHGFRLKNGTIHGVKLIANGYYKETNIAAAALGSRGGAAATSAQAAAGRINAAKAREVRKATGRLGGRPPNRPQCGTP